MSDIKITEHIITKDYVRQLEKEIAELKEELKRHISNNTLETYKENMKLKEMNRKLANHNHDYSLEVEDLKRYNWELKQQKKNQLADAREVIEFYADKNNARTYGGFKAREYLENNK